MSCTYIESSRYNKSFLSILKIHVHYLEHKGKKYLIVQVLDLRKKKHTQDVSISYEKSSQINRIGNMES